MGRDAAARRRAARALPAIEARLRSVVDHLPIVLFALDRDGAFTLSEGRGLAALGLKPGTVVGRSIFDVYHDVPELLAHVRRALAGDAVVATVDVAGAVFETRYLPLRDEAGAPSGVLGVSIDVTARVRMEEELRHQALHDALTGLPNRTLLLDRLAHAIHGARRRREPLALLVLDLNGFREVNDTVGHHYGDLLLRQVADRLRGLMRASDTVARLGGDEFALILPGNDVPAAAALATRLLHALDQPVVVDGYSLYGAGSIGVALYPDHGDDAPALLRHADVAMYAAKRQEVGYVLYDPTRDPYDPGALLLVGDLRRAIEAGELVLHYQPRLHLATGRRDGVEALVRWEHPQHGLLAPGQFVPLAEHARLIRPLSRWVLSAAVQQCTAWRRQGLAVQVVVNLSVQDLHDPGLERAIVGVLERWGADPSWLAVEITESSIMTHPEHAMQAIARLHALGIRTAIDDFGTGYSSLAYLKHLRLDELKIDRSFVRDMLRSHSDAIIVQAVVDLGHRLGLQVVAEGVEDGETLAALTRLGCDYAQGYYLSPPMPPDQTIAWLTTSG